MRLGTKMLTCAACAVLIATIGSSAVTYVVLRGQHIEHVHEVMRSMILHAGTVRENVDHLHTRGAFDLAKTTDALAPRVGPTPADGWALSQPHLHTGIPQSTRPWAT